MNYSDITSILLEVPQIVSTNLSQVLDGRIKRHQKTDGSYVTDGDLLMQELLTSFLVQRIPDITIVSEEFAVNPMAISDGISVVIDPIDGTENFTSGLPEWGVSVACYKQGQHIASLLGCPEFGIWHGTGVSLAQRYSSRIRGLSSSLSRDDLLAATQGYEYRIIGCCVYNMVNVIQGKFFSFENPKGANSWDILAGLNLALEQGLEVTVDGKPYAGEYLTPDRKYRFKIENK